MTQLQIAVRPRLKPLSQLQHLRTTSLRVFEQCPHTWAEQYLQWEPPAEDDRSVYAAIGTAAHTICEHHLAEIGLHFETMQRQSVAQANLEKAWATIPANEMANVNDYLQSLTDFCFGEGWAPLAQELEFTLPIMPHMPPVRGHVDCLLWSKETNGLLILDHKTNRRLDPLSYWQADIQPALYSWAIRQMYPAHNLQFRLGYVNIEAYYQWDAPKDDDYDIQQRLARIWATMQGCEANGVWPERIGANCGFCQLKNTCVSLKESSDNLNESFMAKVGQKSLGEQREWLKGLRKAIDVMLDELDDQLKDAVMAAGGSVQQGGLVYSLKTSKTRKLPAHVCMLTLNKVWPELSDDEKYIVGETLEKLLTVKVGGVDTLAKTVPVLGRMLEAGIVTVESAPSLDARAPKKGIAEE
jgi:hypothetical protein